MILRPHQVKMYDATYGLLRAGKKRVVIQGVTGIGKTAIAANMLLNAARKGFRAWFCVHRREILSQAVVSLADWGVDVGVIASGFPTHSRAPVQVCSIQSLPRRMKIVQVPDLVVLDEVHHAVCASWSDIIRQLPDAVVIGLTATPQLLSGRGLDEHFTDMVLGPSMADLIRDGWLSPYRLFCPPGPPDMSGVHTVAGDYNKRELAIQMAASRVMGDAVSLYRKHTMNKRAIAFPWSVEASIGTAAQFNAAGIPAAHIDGETDERERDRAVKSFRDGQTLVLSNVDIISEGFDVPSAEVLFDMAPTQSLCRYLQRIGRVMRFEPNKVAMLFDMAGNSLRHGLPDDDRQWTLEGRPRGAAKQVAPVKMCPACFGVMAAGKSRCDYCGYEFESQAREMETVEGDLQEVDVAARQQQHKTEQRECSTEAELIELGRRRGYKDPRGWARHLWPFLQAAAERRQRRAADAQGAAKPMDAERLVYG